MARRLLLLFAALGALLLTACGDPGTGPVEVKWDRDACERCRMVLSDRFHSAQVRGGPSDGKSRVYTFDDVGCAMVWLDDKPWKDDPATEFWVNDHRDGTWIEARKAWYVTGNNTPMAYGLGAQDEPAEDALNFEQARAHVFQVEETYNVHSGHLADPQAGQH